MQQQSSPAVGAGAAPRAAPQLAGEPLLYKSKNRVSMIQTVGVVAIITSHVLINIGMTLGLMPVVGVPLPFFSYGGSSMISMMFGIGLLLNIRMRRFEAG